MVWKYKQIRNIFIDEKVNAVNRAYHGVGCWSVSLDWLAVSIHQEFGEVPLDVISEGSRKFWFQIDVKRMGICSINFNFGEHVKIGSTRASKFLYLLMWSGLLATELIAGECQDAKALASIFFIKLNKFLVVGSSQSTFAGNIHNQRNQSAEKVIQRVRLVCEASCNFMI